jgi:hypothetical protein
VVTDRETDGWISDLVGSLTAPIIVMPGGWGADLPEWIREEITVERIIENMKSAKGEEMMGIKLECCCLYLRTKSSVVDIMRQWTGDLVVIGIKIKNNPISALNIIFGN